VITKDDWRYVNGESLKGKAFVFKKYKPINADNDHDHCSFCWDKFCLSIDDALKEGYQTILKSIIWKGEKRKQDQWVCSECFNDFKKLLDLKVKESE
jgi:hypothetical protein